MLMSGKSSRRPARVMETTIGCGSYSSNATASPGRLSSQVAMAPWARAATPKLVAAGSAPSKSNGPEGAGPARVVSAASAVLVRQAYGISFWFPSCASSASSGATLCPSSPSPASWPFSQPASPFGARWGPYSSDCAKGRTGEEHNFGCCVTLAQPCCASAF